MLTNDISCVLTALSFFVGSILEIVCEQAYRNAIKRLQDDGPSLADLDVLAIQEMFYVRFETARVEVAAGVFKCVGWVLLASVMVRVAVMIWTTNTTDKLDGTLVTLGIVAMWGAFAETMSTLMYLGMMKGLQYIEFSYEVDEWVGRVQNSDGGNGYVADGLGWKTLELLRSAMTGLMQFMSALEFLFLAVITILVAVAVFRTGKFSNEWGATGIVIALLSMAEFVVETLAYADNQSLGIVATTLGAVNRMVLLPFWLLWLSFLIPVELEKMKQAKLSARVRLGGMWARERPIKDPERIHPSIVM